MSEHLVYRGKLTGHSNWVTCLATSMTDNSLLLSGSRDKTVYVWELTFQQGNFGFAKKSLQGHTHIVSDVTISSDGQHALSASWDNTLRMWDINKGETTRVFHGHSKDVLSVAFSQDNRQVISGGRDRALNVWNVLGECKYPIENAHNGWVSKVTFSPTKKVFVSAGHDNTVKVWDQTTFQLVKTFEGHTGYINDVAVSPDGSLCASGGKDGKAMLWDLSKGTHLNVLEAGDEVTALAFNPNRYWLCAATPQCIKIWDLESKDIIAELVPESKGKTKPACTSLCWSSDGSSLFSGYTDNAIRVWGCQ